jgi:hypothetical protein
MTAPRNVRYLTVTPPRRLIDPRTAAITATFVLAAVGIYALGVRNGTAQAAAGPTLEPQATTAAQPLGAPSGNAPGVGLPASTPEPPAATAPPAPDRSVDRTGGVRVTTVSSGSCTAVAPEGWTIQASDRADLAELVSADGEVYAGYGIKPVNTTLADYASLYDPPLNDPELYSWDAATTALAHGRIVVAALGGSTDLAYDEEVELPTGSYRLATVSSSTHSGALFFHATGFPGDGVGYSYALPMYFALAPRDRWVEDGLIAARVAASIRCTTQFQPPDDYVEVGDLAAGSGDVNGDEPGYNPQLGTEYAHDPDTGENFLLSPADSWSETGPDGPGYYVPKGGGDYQKLEPGRAD